MICITAKINPDLDGVACIMAYAELLQNQNMRVEGCVFGIPQSEVQYFIKKHLIPVACYPNKISSKWDRFILVDASSMKGMPQVVENNLVMEIIDHREGNPKVEFPHAKIQNELIGAAATLIVERFMKQNLLPSINNAKLLYGAIFHNTLNFISSNATERDKQAIQFLEKHFGLSEDIAQQMFSYATQEILSNPDQAIISDAKQFDTFNFYQLIVSNFDYEKIEKQIAQTIQKQDMKHPCQWSLLNLIDVTKKRSALYVPCKKGQDIIEKALQCSFINSWAIIPSMLRKQITPKIMQLTKIARTRRSRKR